MPNIDNRVVSMTFDNDRFESRLADTISSLDKLNDTIANLGANDDLDRLSESVGNFNTDHMADALDVISSKFTALGAVGFTIIQRLTDGVLNFVGSLIDIGKRDVLGPILTGGKERAMNIEQAKFMFEGMGADVEKSMKSAKDAVLGTAYGLDQAAKVAAQLGASGIKAGDQMTGALRGIAGAAAMTGSSFAEIGDIFAQSAASGKVRTIDLQQFSSRGLNAAAAIAPVLKKTEQEVREMASEGTLDFATFADAMNKAFGKHATEANKTYAGSLSNLHAAMSRMGEALLAPRLNQERDVFNALTPAVDKMTTALKPLFQVFTDIGATVSKNLIKAINNINFKAIEAGFKVIAAGARQIWTALTLVAGAIKAGFKEIFPASATSGFIKFADIFKQFADFLVPSAHTIMVISHVFAALFGIVQIGWTLIKELVLAIKALIAPLELTNGKSSDFIDKLALMIIHLNKVLVAGGGIHRFFFETLPNAFHATEDWINRVIAKFDELKQKVVDFFTKGAAGNAVDSGLDRIKQRADEVTNVWERLQDFWNKIQPGLDKVWNAISKWFNELGAKIANAFQPGDFNNAIDAVNVGLLGGILAVLRKFQKGGLGIKFDFAEGIADKIKGAFGAMTDTLKAMQAQIKAETLEKIAISIALITASLLVLSLIDSKKLTVALLAMSAGFAELVAVMGTLDKIGSGKDGSSTTKLVALAGSMIAISTAALILSGALAILATIDPLKLAQALLGFGAAMAILVATLESIKNGGPGMLAAAGAMDLIAGAMVVLTGVIVGLSVVDPIKLAIGLGALAATLAILVGALEIVKNGGPGMIAAAFAMQLMTGALVILSGAIAVMAAIDPLKLATALIAVGAALAILVATLQVIKNGGPGMLLAAGAMVLLAGALNLMATAILLMGQAGADTLAKGLEGLGLALLIIVVAMKGMQDALPGAAALLVVSGALAILAGVLLVLGQMKPLQIVQAILAVVAVIAALVAISVGFSEAIPLVLAMGLAIGLLGAGFMLLGGGIFLLGKGLEALAQSGEAGLKVLGVMGSALIKTLLTAITDNAKQLLDAVPLLIRLVEAILDQLLITIIKIAPKLANALISLFKNALKALREIYPDLIATGLFLLLKLLEGIANNIGPIVEAATNIIINFLQALAQQVPLIIQAGVDLLIAYIFGIASGIIQIVDVVAQIIIAFVTEIANRYNDIITAGFNILINFLLGISNNISRVIDTVTAIIETFIIQIGLRAADIANTGTSVLIYFLSNIAGDIQKVIDTVGTLIGNIIGEIGKKAGDIAAAGTQALTTFLGALGGDVKTISNAVVRLMSDVVDAMVNFLNNTPEQLKKLADAFIGFLNGVGDVIKKEAKPLGEAMAHVAEAIIGGFKDALISALKKLANDELPGPLAGVVNKAIDVFSHSPLERGVFYEIGQRIMVGFGNALTEGLDNSANAVGSGSNAIVNSMSTALSNASDILGNTAEFNPTITPVLDLSQVQTEAGKINGMLSLKDLQPGASVNLAGDISAQQALIQAAKAQADQSIVPAKDVTFNQTINAPQPLSANEVYRNTKSQIALAKEELNI